MCCKTRVARASSAISIPRQHCEQLVHLAPDKRAHKRVYLLHEYQQRTQLLTAAAKGQAQSQAEAAPAWAGHPVRWRCSAPAWRRRQKHLQQISRPVANDDAK